MRHLGLIAALLVMGSAKDAEAFVWPNTTERVQRDLASRDVQTRRQAADRLRDLSDSAIRRLAAVALADPDAEVRLAAADAALGARIDKLGQRVTPWLNETDARLRLAAAEILRVNPTPDATAALGRALADPNAEVRVAAAIALGASGDKDAALSLLGHLDDSQPDVRISVVEALSRLRDTRAVVPLIGKIQDTNDQVRRAVAYALGSLGEPRAASALLLALRDRDQDVRVAALAALGTLRAEDAALAVASLLEEDPRPGVQQAALAALADIPGGTSLDALIRGLGEEDREERDFARSMVVRAGARAVPRLLQCLAGQPSPLVADGCALALAELGGPEAYDAVTGALRRGVTSPAAAVAALGSLGDRRALALVLEHLSASDPFVRRAAIGSAMALLDPAHPDGRAVEPITRALDRARSRRRERAALTALLGRTGSPRAAEALVPLATAADDPALRVAAVRALGELQASGQDSTLLRSLKDEHAVVRYEAAVALRKQGAAKTAPVLLQLLESSTAHERLGLALALMGPLRKARDPELGDRVERLIRASRVGERDALIEALGAMPGAAGSSRLARLLEEGVEVAARSKIAEALAAHPEAASLLAKLARDGHPAVRANAIWSLGVVGGEESLAVLRTGLRDRDVAVAANAAAALGRLGERGLPVQQSLCESLKDPRSYVRANALAAMSVVRGRCDAPLEREMLGQDPSRLVRAAAAELMTALPDGKLGKDDRLALERCLAEDPAGDVALACRALPSAAGDQRHTEPITVYIVPSGKTEPEPSAPFALVLANGLMRLGLADRRGAVYEAFAPPGTVRLEVPAPLAR